MTNSVRNTYSIIQLLQKMRIVSIINVMSVETEETIHTSLMPDGMRWEIKIRKSMMCTLLGDIFWLENLILQYKCTYLCLH